MRVLLVVGVVLLILFVAGIIRFEQSDDDETLRIETPTSAQPVDHALKPGRERLPEASHRRADDGQLDAPDRTGTHHPIARPVAATRGA